MPTERLTPRGGCRVLLAESRFMTRADLRRVIMLAGHEVVAEARDGLEASRLAVVLSPDVAVIDLSIPVMGGLAAGRLMSHLSPRTRLIAIGAHDDPGFISAVLESGFMGFLLRRQAPAHLARAIQVVHDGAVYVEPAGLPPAAGTAPAGG